MSKKKKKIVRLLTVEANDQASILEGIANALEEFGVTMYDHPDYRGKKGVKGMLGLVFTDGTASDKEMRGRFPVEAVGQVDSNDDGPCDCSVCNRHRRQDKPQDGSDTMAKIAKELGLEVGVIKVNKSGAFPSSIEEIAKMLGIDLVQIKASPMKKTQGIRLREFILDCMKRRVYASVTLEQMSSMVVACPELIETRVFMNWVRAKSEQARKG